MNETATTDRDAVATLAEELLALCSDAGDNMAHVVSAQATALAVTLDILFVSNPDTEALAHNQASARKLLQTLQDVVDAAGTKTSPASSRVH
jgi:folate-dependent phosphoribosylglycinamide formyltransferase PurN